MKRFLIVFLLGGTLWAQEVLPLPTMMRVHSLQPQSVADAKLLIDNRWFEKGLAFLETKPESEEVLSLKARAWMGLNDYARASGLLFRLAETAGDGGKRKEYRFLLAKALSRMKHYREALDLYESAIARGAPRAVVWAAAKTALEGKLYGECFHLLKNIPGEKANWYQGWCAWRDGKPALALKIWEQIQNKKGNLFHSRALYWRAHLMEAAGDAAQARALLETLAAEYPVTYYGYLGLMRLHPKKGELKRAIRASWSADSAVAGKRHFPLRDGALRLWWEERYPRPHAQTVMVEARRRGIDPNWIWAQMRQESYFQETVLSSAGAVGLMQLMPQTALKLARSSGLSSFDLPDIFRPEVNIRLGSFYLKFLLRLFGNNRPQALAAYNAGEEAVLRWTSLRENDPPLFFIEEIPFDETQKYVRQVLTHDWVYRWIYEEGVPSLKINGF